MEVQGLLGNVHKLQTSRHRPRILIVMFELEKCSLQKSLNKPALDFEAIWFSCTSHLLIFFLHDQSFVSNNTGDAHRLELIPLADPWTQQDEN